MAVPDVREGMSEAELRAIVADCIKALEEGGADNPAEIRTLEEGAPVDRLGLMLARDHARFLLQKLAAETIADDG